MKAIISPEPVLLGFLANRPLHGYDLYKEVRRQLGFVWRVEISQMYAILSTYATRGWIGTRVQAQDTRPAKKILELTPAGRRALEEWMQKPARGMREFRVDFFLRLYFARAAGAPAAKKLIAQQIASLRKELKTLSAPEAVSQGENELNHLIRDFRIQQSTATLKWLASHRNQLVRSSASLRFNEPIFRRKTNR